MTAKETAVDWLIFFFWYCLLLGVAALLAFLSGISYYSVVALIALALIVTKEVREWRWNKNAIAILKGVKE